MPVRLIPPDIAYLFRFNQRKCMAITVSLGQRDWWSRPRSTNTVLSGGISDVSPLEIQGLATGALEPFTPADGRPIRPIRRPQLRQVTTTGTNRIGLACVGFVGAMPTNITVTEQDQLLGL